MSPFISRRRTDVAAAVALACLLLAAEVFRHWTFRSTSFDLGIFHQSVWLLSKGDGGTSTLLGWNIFADHLSPILLVFVPLYWVFASPIWFFIAQAVAIGLGLLCLRPLCTEVGLTDQRAVAGLLAAFAVNPLLWNAVLYDFHPLTLSVPVLLIACTAALRHDNRALLISTIAMALLRDDLVVAAAAIAFVGWSSASSSDRRFRRWIIGGSLVWMVLGAQLGTVMGSDRFFSLRYGYLGDSLTDAVRSPVHAVTGVVEHVMSAGSLGFLVWILVPLVGLALLSPKWCALAVFLCLPNMASQDPNLHSHAFQYGAPLVPVMFLAAADGLRRLPVVWTRLWPVVPLGAALSFVAIGPTSTLALSRPAVSPTDAKAALASLPSDARIAASDSLGPHIAARQVLTRVLPTRTATTADAIVVDRVTDGRLLGVVQRAAEKAGFVEHDFGQVVVFERSDLASN